MLNKSHIDGHGNVVIQDADSSTITINLSDTEQVRKFFIDFQNKLDELIGNPILRQQYIEKGKNQAAKFESKRLINEINNIYLETLLKQ